MTRTSPKITDEHIEALAHTIYNLTMESRAPARRIRTLWTLLEELLGREITELPDKGIPPFNLQHYIAQKAFWFGSFS